MAYIYAYAPDEDDCSTIGLVGALLDEDAEFNLKAGEFGELTFTHPVDPYGKWKALVNGAILKTMVPMRLCPGLKENGTYIATVDKYTVSATATKLQRYIYSGNGLTKNGKKQDGKKKKLLKVGQVVTVTGVADASDSNSRYKVKLGKVSGWMERAGLTLTQQNVPVEQDEGGLESTEPSYAVRQQLFRIYEVNPQTSDSDPGSIEVHARRIVYDLLGNISTYKNNGSLTCRTACENVLSSAVMPHDFTIFTDIGDSHVGFDAMNINPISALVDPENGVTARWGAEIVCDDYEIYVLHRAGLDRGVHIEYAKNLIGVDLSEDVSNVATAIRPAGEDKNGNVLYIGGSVVNGRHVYNGGTQLPTGYHFYIKPDGTVNGAIVVRAGYDNESLPRIHFEEVSDAKVGKNKNDVTVAIARQMLVERAVELFNGGCDVPEISMSVDFVMLGDTAEYAQYKHLEPLFVYDTVHIHDRRVGVKSDIDLTEITWLVRPERVSAAEFGALKDMTASISGWQISSVSGAKILPGTVGAGQIGDDTISARAIQADSVNADAIQAESVTAGKVAAGAITTEKLDAGAVTADKLAANAVTAAKIDAHSVSAAVVDTTEFSAASATIADARIGSADIGFAQIKDADIQQLIAQDAITQRYFIEKLQVLSAQIAEATVGQLVVKAADNNYYTLEISYDNSGNPQITPTLRTTTAAEIAAGMTSDGHASIIETDLTVADLAAGNLKAINALIDTLTAGRLYANQAFINELHTSLITDDDFVNVVVGVGNAQSAADAAQQDIDNLSVGGRNFVRNSEALRSLTRNMTKNTSYSWNPDPQWLLSDYAKAILNADDYQETLIVSFDGKASKVGCTFGITVRTDTNGIGYMSVAALVKSANTWVRYSIPLTRNSGSDDYVLTHLRATLTAPSDGSATFEIRRMKLELGNRSTDWTPAPEDTDADITTAQTTANGAASAASNAQNTADGAASAASAAQSTADGAASAASAAQATANAKADPMTATAHGNNIVVSDSADAAIGGLVLYGRSEQGGQTTGKNLLPFEVNTPVAPNGVEINILPDGGVKIVGTTTALATYLFHADTSKLNVPAGTYRFLLTGSGTGFTGSNILLQLYTNTGSGLTSRLTTTDGTYTIGSNVTADYVRLRIASGVTCDCVVYPMMMLNSITDTTFEKYTGAMPAPNPLFPSLISSAGMSLGKNLLVFKRGETTTGGVTFSPQPDGSLYISGTASATIQYNPYTDYTVLNIPHGMYRIRISGTGTGAGDVRVQMYEDRGSGLAIASAWNNEDYICIVRDDVVANTIRIRVAAGTYDCVVYPMVLPAYTDDTSFEGYTNGPVGTQITLTCADDAQGTNATHTILPTPNGLPGIAVSSGGNYTDASGQQWICDTIDLAAGTYTKRVGQYTFDGSEGWTTGTLPSSLDSSLRRFRYNGLASQIMAPPSDSSTVNAACSHYAVKPFTTSGGVYYANQGISVSDVGGINIYDETYGTESGFAAWKAMLAARPMHCLFALATPVTTPLTEAQLTALRSLRTRDGSTALTNDAGADMDLVYATQTGGGSYVEGVRQGLDDGIGKAQGAADAAQVTADAAREDFQRVVRTDIEGLHVGDSQTNNEVLIDSESVNVVLGGRKYSKFAGDYVQFGDYQLRRSVDGGLVFKKA